MLKISFNSAFTQVNSEASRALAEAASPWQHPAQAHHTVRELARAALLLEKLVEVSKLCLSLLYGKADLQKKALLETNLPTCSFPVNCSLDV